MQSLIKLKRLRDSLKLDQSRQFLMEIAHCLPSSVYDEFMIKLQALIVSEKGVFLDDTYYDSIGCLLNQFTK